MQSIDGDLRCHVFPVTWCLDMLRVVGPHPQIYFLGYSWKITRHTPDVSDRLKSNVQQSQGGSEQGGFARRGHRVSLLGPGLRFLKQSQARHESDSCPSILGALTRFSSVHAAPLTMPFLVIPRQAIQALEAEDRGRQPPAQVWMKHADLEPDTQPVAGPASI